MADVPEFTKPDPDQQTTTESGLKYQVFEAGEGDSPVATDSVTVHYAGWLTDGSMFDASYSRGVTASFPLNGVISGWTEGLQLMKPGAKFLFEIPSDLAYGEPGRPPVIPPSATLIFLVELVKIG
jgi:FKBP-type peptidyl-prolyl cis-trans isomerase